MKMEKIEHLVKSLDSLNSDIKSLYKKQSSIFEQLEKLACLEWLDAHNYSNIRELRKDIEIKTPIKNAQILEIETFFFFVSSDYIDDDDNANKCFLSKFTEYTINNDFSNYIYNSLSDLDDELVPKCIVTMSYSKNGKISVKRFIYNEYGSYKESRFILDNYLVILPVKSKEPVISLIDLEEIDGDNQVKVYSINLSDDTFDYALDDELEEFVKTNKKLFLDIWKGDTFIDKVSVNI